MSQLNKTVFGKKKFSALLKEIYDNQNTKKTQISELINQLKPLINEIGDATILVPLIKEYLDAGVKNDDLLIKMAALAQRALQSEETASGGLALSEEEKEQLIAISEEVKIQAGESLNKGKKGT